MSEKHALASLDSYFEPSKRTWAIFSISTLSLFLEMMLIRWIGTEVRIFAYLQNTILIACFLGLGLGCFTSRQEIDLRKSLFPLTLLLLLMAIPVSRYLFGHTSDFLSVLSDMVIWGESRDVLTMDSVGRIIYVILGLALTYVLLIMIVDIFVPFGRLLARLMDDHPNTIWAYSVNIVGSLVGTWLFVLLSYFYQPPFVWFLFVAGLLLFFVIWSQGDKRLDVGLLVTIIILSWFAGYVPGSLDVIWSPYQKLVVQKMVDLDAGEKYVVTVNNTGYQEMIDLSESNTVSNSKKFLPELRGLSQYDIPLLLHPKPQRYLIVGAGTGNDAAGGIRNGAKEITAVEIDPAIISIGHSLHPERPYSSPAVHVVTDDARSFFATTSKKFDVISFGLLDSHTTTAMTNARLDHYVYTRESINRAKELLDDGGVLVLTFEARRLYIADRLARVLREVFHKDPLVFRIPYGAYGWGGVMFVTGDVNAVKSQIARNPRLQEFIAQLQRRFHIPLTYSTELATDDWPYLYLDSPRIPVLYYLLAALMLLILFRSSRHWKARDLITRWHRSHWHFFLLGSAFLLLEVQNISKSSVVLGNTWDTNAVIVSGVLVMVLLANWAVNRFPRMRIAPVYVCLIGICLALYFVDLAQFAFLPYGAKVIVVGGLTALPVLFSGIIFIRSFATADKKDEALGANMVGSLVGALIQSVTFVVGMKFLLLIVACMYFLSALAKPRRLA